MWVLLTTNERKSTHLPPSSSLSILRWQAQILTGAVCLALAFSYTLATSLNTQLDDLARSLTSMIDEVNALTTNSTSASSSQSAKANATGANIDDDDPMGQIQGILNAHLESLTWINTTVKDLEGKVVDLEGKFGTGVSERETGGNGYDQRSGGLGRSSTVAEGLGGSTRFGGRGLGPSSSTYGMRW